MMSSIAIQAIFIGLTIIAFPWPSRHEYLCRFVRPGDVLYCLSRSWMARVTPLGPHPLKEIDIKRARDALRNDPFVQHYKSRQDSINQLLDMGVRAEQQAFAVHDLKYVMNDYLPEKLAHAKRFLP
jgi:hypothetical protein